TNGLPTTPRLTKGWPTTPRLTNGLLPTPRFTNALPPGIPRPEKPGPPPKLRPPSGAPPPMCPPPPPPPPVCPLPPRPPPPCCAEASVASDRLPSARIAANARTDLLVMFLAPFLADSVSVHRIRINFSSKDPQRPGKHAEHVILVKCQKFTACGKWRRA